MRATINVDEKRGFFSTGWTVRCQVEFTSAEETVIRQAKLGDRTIYKDFGEEVSLGQFMGKGSQLTWKFSDTMAAQDNKRYLEDTMLPMIKSWIEAAGAFTAGSQTLEF